MLLERRNVRVTEHGEAVGAKLEAAANRVEAGGDGLVRQSIDQIEVDAGDAGAPQALGRGGGLLETLHPVDGALHGGIEALHAEARPVHAAKGERVDHRIGQGTRVDLDGDLGRGKHEEGVPDRSDQIREGLGRHDRRRSAAEVDVVDLDAAVDLSRYLVDFAAERGGIGRNGLVAAGDRSVTAAIPAHRPAERDVQIERRGGVRRNGFQPFGVGVGTDGGRKMRRGRIARIAGQPFLPVARRKIWPHHLPRPRMDRTASGLRPGTPGSAIS